MNSHAKPIHFVVPMSGQGNRYQAAGYTQPKPLIPVNGRPMIKLLLEKIPTAWPCTFVLAENHRNSDLPAVLLNLRPNARLIFIEEHKKGPGWALEQALPFLPADAPILVSYCDYGLQWDPIAFESFVAGNQCDACLVCYRGFHAHYLSPVTYAYARMDGERVVEVREKGFFTNCRESEYASCGAYYFGSAQILSDALAQQKQSDLTLNGESYTSLTIQALLQMRPESQVRVFEIPAFFQWGTPQDLRTFEFWERSMVAYSRALGTATPMEELAPQILMPMAGLGSRFSSLYKTPKPFLPVAGVPMFRRGANSFRSKPKTTKFVALEIHKPFFEPLLHAGEQCIWLKSTPPGQAHSVAAGVELLEAEGDIVVTACDHAVALDENAFAAFRAQPNCDVGIFAVRGFPGAQAKPQSYAWLALNPATINETHPLIESVSVKKPLGNPASDPVLIGSFWFRNRDVLQICLGELQKQNPLVNGELYLDSIVNLLKELGMTARIIPCAGFVCWGDPDSLAEAIYWQEVFGGRSFVQRTRYPGVLDV